VDVDKHGEFVDMSDKKPELPHSEYVQETRNAFILHDAQSHVRLCYYCGRSAVYLPMVSCDYCPLHWHLDCMNPPMSNMPPLTRKWMCPNHAERAFVPTFVYGEMDRRHGVVWTLW
jgi:hypothetical protein